MTEPLKPCPFCGAAPLCETVGSFAGRLFCADADCPASDMNPQTIADWNRRAVDVEAILAVTNDIADAVDGCG